MSYEKVGKLQVASTLHRFINSEALPNSGLDSEKFWSDFENLVEDLTPINKQLLDYRGALQEKINAWHKENKDYNLADYKAFLTEIGYLEPEVADFKITSENIDTEIANQAGPQLVVPVDNARYALNAANARWGSLYDALYGTNVISDDGGAEAKKEFNPARGNKVIKYAKDFLDQSAPLEGASHAEVVKYYVVDGQLAVTLSNDKTDGLKDPSQFKGYRGAAENPDAVLLKHNALHMEIQMDPLNQVGKTDLAGVKDILMESTLSVIMDCEDSITAVDADDKVFVYQNWLGLIKGDLEATFRKNGEVMTRRLHEDREYTGPKEELVTLSGRSLMYVRNVGHLTTTSAVLDAEGNEMYEGMLDCIVTSLIAKQDLLGNGLYRNSAKGSIYIVKPKMHGSAEAGFANLLFNRVEDLLDLKRNTIKIGLMDEERRMSLNLKNAIEQVKERIAFINTGFLDRTGDEMHTSMEAGPMILKNDMKTTGWLSAYEQSNVYTGLAAGFQDHAQIGKGMWAMPDLMKEMLEQKIGHVQSGANTAWVPSPVAATLHTLHYHQVNLEEIRRNILKTDKNFIDDILQIPVAKNPNWSEEEIRDEVDNNVQGILGYVVRWVEQGVGCSTVPDISDVGLMEDRATLRISSQHVANWLHHNICSVEVVEDSIKRMAKVVDGQNANDPIYIPMTENYETSIAVKAAKDLIFKGAEQPNGYTEIILHDRRREFKAELNK